MAMVGKQQEHISQVIDIYLFRNLMKNVPLLQRRKWGST
jgi:hypothetical protein